MSTSTKIVFPAPPPTTNSLTSTQRAQLLRTTKKLERLLGTAPHVLDLDLIGEDPFYVDLYKTSSRESSSSYDSSTSLKRSLSSASTRSSRSSVSSRRLKEDVFTTKLPVLKLSLPVPQLESIPASPLSGTFDDKRFMLRPSSVLPSISPRFSIPSNNSIRRQKLERLRRTLGDGVPLNMVFKEDLLEEEAEEKEEKQQKVLPAIPARRTISSTRDSIALPSSPHRVRRKPVPKLVASRPAPPPPSSESKTACSAAKPPRKPKAKPAPMPAVIRREKARLSLIMESPDENGGSVEVQAIWGVRGWSMQTI
ncbi:hypothetical protein C8J56DRAFT_953035 [Mycena floridula]|nr:hypothetical protein C8J56DRAFT_953035 [Mycena floridula]